MQFANRQNVNSITVGDEVAIGTEHFYVVSLDSLETVLLTKYNLNVGSNKNPNVAEGLQAENIIGKNNNGEQVYCTVAFSSTYLDGNNSNLNQYITECVNTLEDNGGYVIGIISTTEYTSYIYT